MHTLAAINAETGQSFPLISLLAPANHHDSHFLGPLVNFGKARGWAKVVGPEMNGRIYFHMGESSDFTAKIGWQEKSSS
jgi:hypothetical protein